MSVFWTKYLKFTLSYLIPKIKMFSKFFYINLDLKPLGPEDNKKKWSALKISVFRGHKAILSGSLNMGVFKEL